MNKTNEHENSQTRTSLVSTRIVEKKIVEQMGLPMLHWGQTKTSQIPDLPCWDLGYKNKKVVKSLIISKCGGLFKYPTTQDSCANIYYLFLHYKRMLNRLKTMSMKQLVQNLIVDMRNSLNCHRSNPTNKNDIIKCFCNSYCIFMCGKRRERWKKQAQQRERQDQMTEQEKNEACNCLPIPAMSPWQYAYPLSNDRTYVTLTHPIAQQTGLPDRHGYRAPSSTLQGH